MPYHMGKHPKCNGVAVIKDSDGKLMGCHPNEAAAKKQLAALYINDPGAKRSPTMQVERRIVETRAVPNEQGPMQDGLPKQFWARIVNYGVVDDYGTKFQEGFADEYLARRLPRLMYGHGGWDHLQEVLGKGVQYRTSKEGVDVLFEFDDFDFVPAARQAAYQLKSGTLDEFSVGFIRQKEKRDPDDGHVWITKARVPDASIVVEGSVPGTKLLAFRAATSTADARLLIDANDAVRIISQFSLGELDIAEALGALKTLSFEEGLTVLDEQETPTEEEQAEQHPEDEPPTPTDVPPSEGEEQGEPGSGVPAPTPGQPAEGGEEPEPSATPQPEASPPEVPDDEALALLAELDEALELAGERSPDVVEFRKPFQGNQYDDGKPPSAKPNLHDPFSPNAKSVTSKTAGLLKVGMSVRYDTGKRKGVGTITGITRGSPGIVHLTDSETKTSLMCPVANVTTLASV